MVSVAVVSVATPLLIAPVPSVVEPSRKVTVPVVFAGRAAVKVTDWPKTVVAAEELTVDVVALAFTTCVNTDEVLAWKFVLPP